MIDIKNVSYTYGKEKIFNNFSTFIKDGEFVVITGKSGSGKTTLLNIIGLLLRPQKGEVYIDEKKVISNKETMLARRYQFGYIIQNYELLENDTVKSNLLLATKYNKSFKKELIEEVLDKVMLPKSILKKKVCNLSGGEQQRVAIARVLLKPCNIILADEPTGNLDGENANIIMQLLIELNAQNKTIICATHDKKFLDIAQKCIDLDEIYV